MMHMDLPDPGLSAYLEGLFCEWCWHCREVCTCAPRPLPVSAPSATVLALQRSMRAETSCEPLDDPGQPSTCETQERPSVPVSGLSPTFLARLRGGAA